MKIGTKYRFIEDDYDGICRLYRVTCFYGKPLLWVADFERDYWSCYERDLIYIEGPPMHTFIEKSPQVLVSTKDMDVETWLEWRRKGVTGTDTASIMGVHPYKTPTDVFREKYRCGQEMPDNDHMWLGREMEDIVARRFTLETGKKLEQRYSMFRHADYEWMLANIDRKVVGEHAIAEMKIATYYSQKNKWGPTGSDQVPEQYFFQVYHYMIVFGVRTAYLAVIFTDTREFRWYEFTLDEEIAQAVIEQTYQFWFENVLKDQIPDIQTFIDLDFAFPIASKPSLVADKALLDLCLEHEIHRAKIKEAKARCDIIKLEIGKALGEHRDLLVDKSGDEVLAKFDRACVRSTIDKQKLQEKYPQIYDDVVKESEPLRTVKMNWRLLQNKQEEHCYE